MRNERKARTLLLRADPKDNLRRFMAWIDAKRSGPAIKTSQYEDANHKFLESSFCPPMRGTVYAMTKRTREEQNIIAMTCHQDKEVLQEDSRRSQRGDGKIHVAFVKRKVECYNCHKLAFAEGVASFKYTKDVKRSQKQKDGQTTDEELNNALMRLSHCEYMRTRWQGKLAFKSNKVQQTVDPSCAQHVKSPRQPIRTPVNSSPIPSNNRQNWNQRMERDLGAGYSFERKPCFVCGSLSHLIKDCDYYEKKMAREAALKSKRVFHADVRQATPAWTNANRVNKANQFTPRPVQLSNIRPNHSTVSRTVKTGRVNVNTGHENVNSGNMHVNSGTQIKSGPYRFNTGKQHVSSGGVNRPVSNNTGPKPSQQSSPANRPFSRNTAYRSNIYAVKGKMGTAVKTSAGCVWRKTTPLSNTNSGPTPDSNDHPLKHMEHRGIFDSGCSGHMTGNRAHLEDYQELSKVGSVTFGGSKGSISGKGTIRLEKVFDVSPFSANDFEYSNRKQTPLSSCKPDQKDIWEYEKGTLLPQTLTHSITNTHHLSPTIYISTSTQSHQPTKPPPIPTPPTTTSPSPKITTTTTPTLEMNLPQMKTSIGALILSTNHFSPSTVKEQAPSSHTWIDLLQHQFPS
ncbi:hypothetical protein Tco_0064916 [Tanacetum coccineum]